MRKLIVLLLLISSVAYGQQRGAVPLRSTTTPFGFVYGPDWLFKVGDSLYGTSAKTTLTGTIADMVTAGTAALIGPGAGGSGSIDSIPFYSVNGRTTQRDPNDSLLLNGIVTFKGTGVINSRSSTDPLKNYARQIFTGQSGTLQESVGYNGSGVYAGSSIIRTVTPAALGISWLFNSSGLGEFKYQMSAQGLYPSLYSTGADYNQFLGVPLYPWNDGYTKNYHFNDTIFLKGRLGDGYIKIWNDRYLRLACDATSFYFPSIPASEKSNILSYDPSTGLIGYSSPLLTYSNGVTDSTSVLYWVGDSMLRGGNCSQPPTSDSVTLPTINGCAIADSNISVGGREIRTADSLYGSFLANNYHPRAINIMVVWLGINDLKTRTAGAAFASLESFCVKYKALGYRIVVATLPSSNVGDALRNEYNRLIRLNYTRFADRIADIGAESHIGVDGSYSDTDLFCDGLHLTILGNDYAAAVLQAAIDDLVLNQSTMYAANINADTVNAVVPGYQPTLVSGTNIKTVNSTSILGSGDIALPASQWTTTGSDIYYNTGSIGAGTTSPQAAFHLNRQTEGRVLTITNSRINKNQSTAAQAADTSALSFYIWPSGAMSWAVTGKTGLNRIYQDSASHIVFSDSVMALREYIVSGNTKYIRSFGTGGLTLEAMATPAVITGDRYNGTFLTPSAVTTDNVLFAVAGRGWNGSAMTTQRTSLRFYASELWTTSSNPTHATISTTPSGAIAQIERFRVDMSGNVGIGTSTPTSTLQVASTSATAPQFRTYKSALGEANPTDSLGLYVTALGNVGVGTSAPTQALEVNGYIKGQRFYGEYLTNPANAFQYIQFDSPRMLLKSLSAGFRFYQGDDHTQAGPYYQFARYTTSSVRGANVDQSYVSIEPLYAQTGTSSYTVLNINATETTTGTGGGNLINASVGGVSKFAIRNTGRVGIGTTAPSSLLHNAGTSRLGNVRADSTKINGLLYLPNIDKDTCANDYDLRWKASTGKATAYPRTKNTGDITAGTGITTAMMAGDMRYNGSSAIDITADPQIADGLDGQEISIVGLSDTNTLTLDDGTGLALAGNATMVLGVGDVIRLRYILSIDTWIELGRSNN